MLYGYFSLMDYDWIGFSNFLARVLFLIVTICPEPRNEVEIIWKWHHQCKYIRLHSFFLTSCLIFFSFQKNKVTGSRLPTFLWPWTETHALAGTTATQAKPGRKIASGTEAKIGYFEEETFGQQFTFNPVFLASFQITVPHPLNCQRLEQLTYGPKLTFWHGPFSSWAPSVRPHVRAGYLLFSLHPGTLSASLISSQQADSIWDSACYSHFW